MFPCHNGQVTELMLNSVPVFEAMVIKPTPSTGRAKVAPNAPLKATFKGVAVAATRAVLPVVVPFTVNV
jgi:hypothetical protein